MSSNWPRPQYGASIATASDRLRAVEERLRDCGVNVGKDVTGDKLRAEHDAVVLCGGAEDDVDCPPHHVFVSEQPSHASDAGSREPVVRRSIAQEAVDCGGQRMRIAVWYDEARVLADVEKLRSAPEPFDRAFIDAMIPHHQDAIGVRSSSAGRCPRAR